MSSVVLNRIRAIKTQIEAVAPDSVVTMTFAKNGLDGIADSNNITDKSIFLNYVNSDLERLENNAIFNVRTKIEVYICSKTKLSGDNMPETLMELTETVMALLTTLSNPQIVLSTDVTPGLLENDTYFNEFFVLLI